MAELLIVVRHHTLENPFDDAGMCKTGDVVEVADDGHKFSALEKTKSEWRILRVQGSAKDEHAALLWSEGDLDARGQVMSKPGPKLGRASTLDLSTADDRLKAYLADDTRAQHAYDISADWLASAIRVKDRGPKPHPAVLG